MCCASGASHRRLAASSFICPRRDSNGHSPLPYDIGRAVGRAPYCSRSEWGRAAVVLRGRWGARSRILGGTSSAARFDDLFAGFVGFGSIDDRVPLQPTMENIFFDEDFTKGTRSVGAHRLPASLRCAVEVFDRSFSPGFTLWRAARSFTPPVNQPVMLDAGEWQGEIEDRSLPIHFSRGVPRDRQYIQNQSSPVYAAYGGRRSAAVRN